MGSWAAANFALDLALLWATGRLLSRPLRAGRLALAAAWGTVSLLWLSGAQGPAALAVGLAATSGLMVSAAFGARPARGWWRALAVFHGVAFAAAGAGALASGLAAGAGISPPLVGAVAALAVMVALARLGPLASRRMAVVAALRVQVHLRFGERWVRLEGLVDTGNRLREPMSQLPVVLVAGEPLARQLPPEIQPVVRQLAAGQHEGVGRLAGLDPRWGARVRAVPFRSVGTPHGLLLGLRTDATRVQLAGGPQVELGPMVAALTAIPLADEGELEALVPADGLLAALAAEGPGVPDAASAPTWRGGAVGARMGL